MLHRRKIEHNFEKTRILFVFIVIPASCILILIEVFPNINENGINRKEGNVLFNDTQHILFSYMVKDHTDSERGNLLPPHGLLFPISSKGSFTCIIPQGG